nr:hypothetical protein [Tanacetum cinerariifolium]
MVYQNFLKEFWSTVVAFDPFLSTNEPEKHPLKEFLIKFSVLNGQRPMNLDFNIFCSSTGLNYNNGKYVDHPTPEDPSKFTDIELTAYMIDVNNQRDSVSLPPLDAKPKKGKSHIVDETQSTILRYRSLTKNKGKTSSKVEPDTKSLQLQTFVDIQSFLLSEYELEKESDDEEVLAVRDDRDEDPQDDVETDQLVASFMSSLDKSSSSISDLYKGMNVITELLKEINNAIKDDPATNKKIDKVIKTFAKISTQTTEILSLVKTFDFSTLQSTMQDLQAHALTQEEASAS